MRIQGSPPPSQNSTRKTGGSKDKSCAFSALLHTESNGDAAETMSGGRVQNTSAMLFAQEVGSADERPPRNQQAANFAHGLLDQLNRIQMGLLNGSLSADQLQSLKKVITHHQQSADNPQLQQTLNDIELRVRVELAKLLPNR